jgi:hypothetical protein
VGLLPCYVRYFIPEGILKHDWNNALEESAAQLEAWVGINFEQPRFELVIYHEIEAKDFKVVLPTRWIEEHIRRLNRLSRYFLK